MSRAQTTWNNGAEVVCLPQLRHASSTSQSRWNASSRRIGQLMAGSIVTRRRAAQEVSDGGTLPVSTLSGASHHPQP
jgi:hypothetical protein